MPINIITIGTKMPSWVTEGFNEYAKRFPKEAKISLIELPTEKRPGNIEKIKTIETERCLAKVKPDQVTIALDEHGKQFSTTTLAKELESWQQQSGHINFLIGGPDGFDKELIKKTKQTWSLSQLTLPHPLVRVVLVEQLYRALMVIKGHPYHRE